jgi:hypothetical protein
MTGGNQQLRGGQWAIRISFIGANRAGAFWTNLSQLSPLNWVKNLNK